MPQPDNRSDGMHASSVAHSLFSFPTVIRAVADDLEVARLTATGISRLLPCCVSGVAHIDESEITWSLVVQK